MSAPKEPARFGVVQHGTPAAEAVRIKTLQLARAIPPALQSHPLYVSALIQLVIAAADAHGVALRDVVAVLQEYERKVSS